MFYFNIFMNTIYLLHFLFVILFTLLFDKTSKSRKHDAYKYIMLKFYFKPLFIYLFIYFIYTFYIIYFVFNF